MIFKKKKHIESYKKEFVNNRFFFITILFLFFSFNAFSQDSIPAAKDLTEEKELKFQEFFFKALSEKSIGNYQKAIENLESCNQILTNEITVFFEFSKNYLLLNNTLLAKEYINRALDKDPNNLWMLTHLVKIYVKDTNFVEAIKVQERVVAINNKEREYLVRLLLKNREYKRAISLMNVLEEEKLLSISLKRIKNSLEKQETNTVTKEEATEVVSLTDKFKSDKSYKLLEQILQSLTNKPEALLKYSEEGISLFPAQPFVYLMNGKALLYQKNYKKALTSLKNGIDFVIEDKMEAEFYNEMANAYKGLGDKIEEEKYRQKAKKI